MYFIVKKKNYYTQRVKEIVDTLFHTKYCFGIVSKVKSLL